jgi:hypothetical protein
LLSIIT